MRHLGAMMADWKVTVCDVKSCPSTRAGLHRQCMDAVMSAFALRNYLLIAMQPNEGRVV